MKLKLRKTMSACLLAALPAFTATAQETYELTEYSQVKGSTMCVPSYGPVADTLPPSVSIYGGSTYLLSRITDNWFVSAGAGISSFIGSPTGCNDFFGREKFALSLSLGKWLSPYVGLRASFDGFRFRDSQNEDYGYRSLRGDILWNVSAYTRPDMSTLPRWDVIPFVGFGAVRNSHFGNKPFALTPGIDVRYRLMSRMYLSGRVSLTMTRTRFDGYGDKGGLRDKMLTATLGLTYNLGGNRWKLRHADGIAAAYRDYDIRLPYTIHRNDYSGLNSLRKRLGSGETSSDSVSTSSHAVGLYYFFFKKGTTKFTDASQRHNINAVCYFMKKYPDYKAVVNGAADSRTGSRSVNRSLSYRRAKAVKAMLVTKGISPARISVLSRGGIDRYSPNTANRQTYVRIYVDD